MEERPLFIFNKIDKDNFIKYYPIIEKTDNVNINSIYYKYNYIPDNIKNLIELHIKSM